MIWERELGARKSGSFGMSSLCQPDRKSIFTSMTSPLVLVVIA